MPEENIYDLEITDKAFGTYHLDPQTKKYVSKEKLIDNSMMLDFDISREG